MSSPLSPPLAEVSFFLTDATKSGQPALDGHAIGRLVFRDWQISPITPLPADLADRRAYLIRVQYELHREPDVPAPAWAEVEFSFHDRSGARVRNALPTRVVVPAANTSSWELTPTLEFAPTTGGGRSWWPAGSSAAHIVVPPMLPEITSSGTGSTFVKWRHSGGVPDGTHTAWFVLEAPAGTTDLSVVADGRYKLDLDETLNLSTGRRPDAFVVPLPVGASPSSVLDTASIPRSTGPRVFISYVEESDAHNATVDALGDLLTTHGVDVRYAPDNKSQRVPWEEWTTTQMRKADYVVLVVSDGLWRASEGTLGPGEHPGIQAEYRKLVSFQHDDPQTWSRKILPVILPGESPEAVPHVFGGRTYTYYEVDPRAPGGAVDLLEVLRADPRTPQ